MDIDPNMTLQADAATGFLECVTQEQRKVPPGRREKKNDAEQPAMSEVPLKRHVRGTRHEYAQVCDLFGK